MAWSYQLLDEHERRVFRAVSVFPGPFTLEGAEAVAGDAAGPTVLRLVDCSLLVPPRAGPDGRSWYGMLETLRAYGAELLAEGGEDAGEDAGVVAALAGYALGVAEEAAAGLETSTVELAAVRRLDGEDATMGQALAWAMDHDPAIALRLAVALAPWWMLRGRLAGQYALLRDAAGRAARGSDGWCAAQYWLGLMAVYSADLAGALGRYTAIRDAIGDRGPSRVLAASLGSRSVVLSCLGRVAEAVDDGRCALALARELGHPAAEAEALADCSVTALYADDLNGAVQLARQAEQITADIPGWLARLCSYVLTGRWWRPGIWPAPSAAAPRGLPGAGTRATCGPWQNC